MKTIGYLCSEYPALSHTFVSREIDILQLNGFTIHTASINPVKGLEKMDLKDQARSKSTYYIKKTSKPRMAWLFFLYLLHLPRFLSVLSFSLNLAWKGGPRRLDKALGYFFQAILLHAWAKKKSIRHIHVHFANPASTVALIATRFHGFSFSISVHGPDEFYNVEQNNLREKMDAALFIRCISYFCQSQLMRISPNSVWSKFHVIRCGLFSNEFMIREIGEQTVFQILCVGRLCPSKGQITLIEAAERLSSKGLSFHILFLGGGEDQETIHHLIEEKGLTSKITLAGSVGHSRVLEELTRADLFVLPSFAEGVPISLMEAMASGVPVVSTRIAGIPELIKDTKEGFLVDASDVVSLTVTLEDFILKRIETKQLIKNASQKIQASYDVEKNTMQLGAIFDTLPEAAS